MRISLDCFSCFMRQSMLLAKRLGSTPEEQQEILRKAGEILAQSSPQNYSTELTRRFEIYLEERTGQQNFYKQEKQDSIALIQKAMPFLQEYLEAHNHSDEAYIKLAVTGNSLDAGVYGDNLEFSRQAVEAQLNRPFAHSDMPVLAQRLDTAKSLLLVGDNVGEHLLDKLLLEHLAPRMQVTYAVRGGYTINDVTMEEALEAGMDKVAKLITTGSNLAGVIPQDCSQEFLDHFYTADLVLCKGMGNFETQEAHPREVFYLFKAKCDYTAQSVDVPLNGLVLLAGGCPRTC